MKYIECGIEYKDEYKVIKRQILTKEILVVTILLLKKYSWLIATIF